MKKSIVRFNNKNRGFQRKKAKNSSDCRKYKGDPQKAYQSDIQNAQK